MNQLLCSEYGVEGCFPTPEALATVTIDELKSRCRVGYRADRIIRLASSIANGELDLNELSLITDRYLSQLPI